MRSILSTLAIILVSFSLQAQTQTKADLEAAEFQAAIENGKALLIDVRTPREFAAGHIPGSVNIDWTAPDYEAQFAKLDPNRPVLLYCAMGGRSDQAREYLSSKGYHAQQLEGGIKAWEEAGNPVEK